MWATFVFMCVCVFKIGRDLVERGGIICKQTHSWSVMFGGWVGKWVIKLSQQNKTKNVKTIFIFNEGKTMFSSKATATSGNGKSDD